MKLGFGGVAMRASTRRHRVIAPLLGLLLVACAATTVTNAANPAGEQLLLSHVPPAIAATCTTQEPADETRQAQVSCHPGGAVSEADYILFDSNDSMNAAFDAHLASFPEATGTDCTAGPSSGSYTIGGQTAGSLFCAALENRAFIEWTDDRFAILTVGFSTGLDYAAIFNWWATDAGPIEGNGIPLPTPAEPTPGETAPGEPTGAPATPSGTPTPGSTSGPKVPDIPVSRLTGASIHQVLFAADLDQTQRRPIGIADTFKTGIPKIVVLVGWDVISMNAPLDVKLFQGDRLLGEQQVTPHNPAKGFTTIDRDGGFAIPFAPEGGFEAGTYTAELDYGGLPEQVASFVVNDTGDGIPLPGNLSVGEPGTTPDLGTVPYADPASVLIVTRSSILRAKMGADADAVLAAAASVGTVHDLSTDFGDNTRPLPPQASIQIVKGLLQGSAYRYVLILGNDDAVPFGHIALPDSVNFSDELAPEGVPGDYVVSDDPYVNTDGDALEIPDLAVARIPTSDDAALLLTQLGENQPKPANTFSLVNEVRRSLADGPVSVINSITPVTLYYSPPTLTDAIPQTNQIDARFIYILLHGDGSKTDTWWGEIQQWTPLNPGDPLTEYTTVENDYSDSLQVAEAGAPGAIVNVGACFGAYTLDTPLEDTHKTRDNSLAMKFLAAGSRAFVADTYISISTDSEPGQLILARTGFEILMWSQVKLGASPVDAYLLAKQQMGQMVATQYASTSRQERLNGEENFLTVHEMIYFGRP